MPEQTSLKTISVFSFLFIILLSGCFGGDRVYFAKDHGIDIEKISLYVRENYKTGTDEKSLIRDFTAKGYRYIPSNNTDQKRRLIYPNVCVPPSRVNGEQVYLAWKSDSQGLISAIEEPKITVCGVMAP